VPTAGASPHAATACTPRRSNGSRLRIAVLSRSDLIPAPRCSHWPSAPLTAPTPQGLRRGPLPWPAGGLQRGASRGRRHCGAALQRGGLPDRLAGQRHRLLWRLQHALLLLPGGRRSPWLLRVRPNRVSAGGASMELRPALALRARLAGASAGRGGAALLRCTHPCLQQLLSWLRAPRPRPPCSQSPPSKELGHLAPTKRLQPDSRRERSRQAVPVMMAESVDCHPPPAASRGCHCTQALSPGWVTAAHHPLRRSWRAGWSSFRTRARWGLQRK
jgi:hypothetical protein